MQPVTNKKIDFWSGNIPGKITVFLVSGKIGIGKTTFSLLLLNQLRFIVSNKVGAYSFALPLKECAKRYFMWDGKKDETGRWLLQAIGTDVGRLYYEDVWVDHFINYSKDKHLNFYIIDDWRFLNEYQKLVNSGYDVITINITSKNRGEYNNHISENSIPEDFIFDYVIDNSYTIGELEKEVENFVSFITKKE